MEAEHFQTNTTASGHAWEPRTNIAGFVGESAMQSTPNISVSILTNVPDSSPALSYQVQFSTTGAYHLWVRGWADDASGDSVHVGVDDQAPQYLSFSGVGAWMWRAKQVVITNAGPHEVKLWMREDGAYVDRLLLCADLKFVPTGAGPAESAFSNAPPVIQITTPAPLDLRNRFGPAKSRFRVRHPPCSSPAGSTARIWNSLIPATNDPSFNSPGT